MADPRVASTESDVICIANQDREIRIPISQFPNQIGGGVWGSNPPKHALAYSLTVLKTAPVTGQDAPPQVGMK